jgi:serine/threonine protein kinase
MIGRTVSHYRIIEQIGAGGIGIVYEAEDIILKRRVAIKTLKDLNSQKARLLREAQSISYINHPNIATVYDYGETEEGRPFIVMELIKGKPLDEYIKENCLSLFQIIEIIIKVTDALSTAHKQGIIHRDIKPSNILVGNNASVKVLDFGLSKQIEDTSGKSASTSGNQILEVTRTQKGVIIGTPLYLSPEQALGEKVDERSDIFSLGTLLYESITGKSPFYAESVIEVCAKVLRDIPLRPSQINSAIPASLDEITLKALAKEPNHRYQSAEELINGLRQAQKHLSKEEIKISQVLPPSRISVSQRLSASFVDVLRHSYLSVFIFSAMALVGLAAFIYWQNHKIYQPLPEAESWYEKGERSLNDGLFFAAKNCFERAFAADERFAMAHARDAEALYELGYIENAREARERANEIISNSSLGLSAQDNFRLQAINKTILFEFDSAAKKYQELLEYTPDSDKAQVYLDLGRAYERNENLPEAIESYRKALTYNADLAPANLRLGILYGRQQEFEKSSSFFSAAERFYKIQNNSEGEIEVSYQRGLLLSTTGDATRAQAEIENSLKKAEINEIPYQQIKCLLLMSRILRSSGKTGEALSFANQAVSSAQQNNIDYLSAQSLLELGTVYFFLSRYEEAKNNYEEALRLARQYKATVLEKRILLQFGAFSVQQHQAEEALNYVNQVQSFFEKGGYKKDMLDLLSIKAQAITIKGDFKTALDTYRDLFAKAAEVGDQVQKARAQKGIATMLANQDDLSNALLAMYESYAIYNSINKTFEAGYSLITYADILSQLGRYEEAVAALNQAEGLAVKYNQLMPRINLVRSKKTLSERNFNRAIQITRQIITADAELKRASTIEAKAILALALVQSGQKLKAKEIIEEIDLNNSKLDEAEIVARIYLIRAEIKLANNLPESALEDAHKAQESFNKLGKPSFEWIAWLLISLAEQQLKDFTSAKQAAANAGVIFSTLSQKWKPEDFKSYSEKTDVKHYQQQLLKSY